MKHFFQIYHWKSDAIQHDSLEEEEENCVSLDELQKPIQSKRNAARYTTEARQESVCPIMIQTRKNNKN